MAEASTGKRASAWQTVQLWWRVLRISYIRHFTSGGYFMGAAIAFYCLVALAPLGMLLATLLQHVLQTALVSEAAYQRLEGMVGELAGGATNYIMDLVRSQAESQTALSPGASLTTNLVSAAIFVWTGLRLFDMIQISLGTIWPGRRIRGIVFRKLVSLAMMLVSGLLFVLVVALLSTRGALNEWLSRLPEVEEIPLVLPHSIVTFSGGVVLSTLAYVLLYKFMPVQRVDTRAALAGAVFAAVLWQSLSPAFTRFIALSQYFHTVFEALLWVIIFGVWTFWGAQIMLYGAQFAAAYQHVFLQRRPRGEDDALIDTTRRRTQVYIGNLDAEAERITEDLGLTGAAPPLALDEAGHQRVNAIILAGGKLPHAFAELVGTDIKGLIDLAGRTSLERVVDALRATAGVQRLVLVADKAAFVHHPVAENLDGIIDEGPDSWHNLMRAVRLLNADQRILISSVDAPLVTAEALEELLSRCDPAADLCLPVTAQGPRRGFFAQRFWSLLPLRGGLVGHTSHLLVDPRLILRSQDFAERFLSRRKDLWGEAGPAGLQFTLRLLLGWFFPRLRFDDKGLAHQLEFLTGARRCQLVPLERPELVLDLDRPADLEEVRGVLKKHEG